MLRWGLRPLVSWHSVSFFERDVSRIRPEIQARIPLEVRRVEHPADVRRLEDYFEQLGRAPVEVATRLAEGDECFIGPPRGSRRPLRLAESWSGDVPRGARHAAPRAWRDLPGGLVHR